MGYNSTCAIQKYKVTYFFLIQFNHAFDKGSLSNLAYNLIEFNRINFYSPRDYLKLIGFPMI